MAMRGLVEGDCGGQNPLTKLRGFYTQDQGRVEERLIRPQTHGGQHVVTGQLTDQDLVTEFLQENNQVIRHRGPTSYRMDSLLNELRQKDGVAGPSTLATRDQAADNWAQQFADNNRNVIEWSDQFLNDNSSPALHNAIQQRSSGWAEDYLAAVPSADQVSLQQNKIDPLEYERFVNSIDNLSLAPSTEIQSGQWADEFIQEAQSQLKDNVQPLPETYKQDFWRNLEAEWKSMGGQEEEHPWLDDYTSSYEPFKEYQFQENNSPSTSSGNALEEGKKKLKEGDLPSAVILFETAVQEQPDNSEGWLLLGTSQAENEQDPQAIAALKKCLELEPNNLSALMCLAVSLTNESYENQACQALQLWLQNNAEYSGLVQEPVDKVSFASSFMSEDLHGKTADLYIQAARMRQGADMDPDVQTGLGVLFNLSSDYDKAADCFRSAVHARPTDSLLWNRLGATLANGNDSENAVDAYRKALWHQPGFIRCRYNLGISCINLKAYTEAAEHFLTALNFQATGRGPQGREAAMSDSIWSSLRLAVSLLNRPDLKELVDRRNLPELTQKFGINIQS